MKWTVVVMTILLGLASVASAQFPPDGIVTSGVRAFTSFENFDEDGDDVSDFFVGDVFFTVGDGGAAVAAAATRAFPPGYRSGEFVWLTALGTSTLLVDSDGPNHISFWAKDVAELFPDVIGLLFVTYQDGSVDVLDVPETYTRFNLRNVSSIDVVTTGITNLDDFSYIGK